MNLEIFLSLMLATMAQTDGLVSETGKTEQKMIQNGKPITVITTWTKSRNEKDPFDINFVINVKKDKNPGN